jgi:hypothetical protein
MEPPSLHRYLYAYSNPIAYFDPTGRAAEDVDDDESKSLWDRFFALLGGDDFSEAAGEAKAAIGQAVETLDQGTSADHMLDEESYMPSRLGEGRVEVISEATQKVGVAAKETAEAVVQGLDTGGRVSIATAAGRFLAKGAKAVLGLFGREGGEEIAEAGATQAARTLTAHEKGELGKAWSAEAAVARGDKVVGEEIELIFNVNGKQVTVHADVFTTREGDDFYVYIESKYSRDASYTKNQQIVIPELVKAGDNGLVAEVGRRSGELSPGTKIRVQFQGDVWSKSPVLEGQ